jgi:hypothetical protein
MDIVPFREEDHMLKGMIVDVLSEVADRNRREENRLLWLLAVIGIIALAAVIAFALYRFLTPDYFEDYDDDDFDDFEDDLEDDEESDEDEDEIEDAA